LSNRYEISNIHVCPNECILYKKEFADLRSCLKCGLSRCKVKNGDNKL